MGIGYIFNCQKCGYEFEAFLGIGMAFEEDHIETLEKAREGKLGKKVQKFFLEHPNADIDSSYVFAQCPKCGKHETVQNLSMYVPKGEKYGLFIRYEHKCKDCGEPLEIIAAKDISEQTAKIKCPHCKSALVGFPGILWD